MLRNKSRALMADLTSSSSSSSTSSYTKPVQNSFFKAFSSIDHSFIISPTSVLDSKSPFFSNYNHHIHNSKTKSIFPPTQHKISCPQKPIGLALIEEKHDSKPSKSLIFSARLRVQIPPPPLPDSAVDGGGGGGDGGEKCGFVSPCEIGNGLMTVEEMEVCEEYTCVRRHGPNAKITHIFDNFVVKSLVDCDSSEIFSMAVVNVKKKNNNNDGNHFLSFCYTCKNNLELTDDIYIYRGEKAFCSHECRYKEMLLDEGEEEEDSS